jgi:hypothetical protein
MSKKDRKTKKFYIKKNRTKKRIGGSLSKIKIDTDENEIEEILLNNEIERIEFINLLEINEHQKKFLFLFKEKINISNPIDKKDITKKWRELLLNYHPDKCNIKNRVKCNELSQIYNTANTTIKDSNKFTIEFSDDIINNYNNKLDELNNDSKKKIRILKNEKALKYRDEAIERLNKIKKEKEDKIKQEEEIISNAKKNLENVERLKKEKEKKEENERKKIKEEYEKELKKIQEDYEEVKKKIKKDPIDLNDYFLPYIRKRIKTKSISSNIFNISRNVFNFSQINPSKIVPIDYNLKNNHSS